MLRLSLALFLALAAGRAGAQDGGSPLTALRAVRVASGINVQPAVREACGITAEVETALNEALRGRIAQAGLSVAPGRQRTQTNPTLAMILPQPNDPALPVLLTMINVQAVQVEKEVVCAASAFSELRAVIGGARVVATGQALEQKPMGVWSHDAAVLIGAAALPGKMPAIAASVGDTFAAAWSKANPAR